MMDLEHGAERFWARRRVGVTGASGFVGHHVALELVRRGACVVALLRQSSQRRYLMEAGVNCVDAPLDDLEAMERAVEGCDLLFHVAGAVSFGGDEAHIAEVNVEGTRRVLMAARQARVRRVVHTSSIASVAFSRDGRPLDESAGWNLAAHDVPYVNSKHRAEKLALQAAGDGQDVVVVNPASVVGPDDFSGSEFGVLCRRFWSGRVPCHFGGGNNFVDVRDVADGMLRAAQWGRSGERYILGGENRTYGEFFRDLCAASGRRRYWLRLPLLAGAGIARLATVFARSGNRRPVLTPHQARLLGLYFYFDCRKANEELGYSPRPLLESLTDAYAFWSGQRQAA